MGMVFVKASYHLSSLSIWILSGNYIPFKKNKELYCNALKQTIDGWIESKNDPVPFIKFILHKFLYAYKEFEKSMDIFEYTSSSYDIVKNTVDSILGKFTKTMILERWPSIAKSIVELSIKKLFEKEFLIKSSENKTSFYYIKNSSYFIYCKEYNHYTTE